MCGVPDNAQNVRQQSWTPPAPPVMPAPLSAPKVHAECHAQEGAVVKEHPGAKMGRMQSSAGGEAKGNLDTQGVRSGENVEVNRTSSGGDGGEGASASPQTQVTETANEASGTSHDLGRGGRRPYTPLGSGGWQLADGLVCGRPSSV